ncbi:AMP-binding protein [Nocardia sp. JMUB6875]|uniref:AMP-binding protein n=1 Tax=Nocardia sp. JMUB6875 TaxID=3158170 RepID=UPI0034E8B7F7
MLRLAAQENSGIVMVDRELNETPLPYARLESMARSVAAGLAHHGVRRGDRVVIMSSTSIASLGCLFGAWMAGAVPVIMPLPHRLSDLPELLAEIRRRLGHVGASCLVVADTFHRFLARRIELDIPVLKCGDLAHHDIGAETFDEVDIDPDDVAYLQFTSGTTGNARAVTLTHRQMLTNVAAAWHDVMAVVEHPTTVLWLPLYHDMGLISMLGSVAIRSRLVLQPPEEYLARPDSWVDALSRYRATSTVAPNFAYELAGRGMLARPRPLDLSSLLICGNGAEPIRADTMTRFAEVGAEYGLRPEAITPMYGLAEGTVAVASSPMAEPMYCDHVSRTDLIDRRYARPVEPGDPDARLLVVCGQPFPGIELEIRDDGGDVLSERHIGEVWFRSPSAMRGYWDEPEETARVLVDGWVRTGDLGYLIPEGLVVCGRIKDMIIVGGRNLYPEDYEHIAARVPGVGTMCVAFSLADTERMIVLVEPDNSVPDLSEVATTVMNRLRIQLGHAPDRVSVVPRDTVPRTSSGKVQRGKCRQRYLNGDVTELASVTR